MRKSITVFLFLLIGCGLIADDIEKDYKVALSANIISPVFYGVASTLGGGYPLIPLEVNAIIKVADGLGLLASSTQAFASGIIFNNYDYLNWYQTYNIGLVYFPLHKKMTGFNLSLSASLIYNYYVDDGNTQQGLMNIFLNPELGYQWIIKKHLVINVGAGAYISLYGSPFLLWPEPIVNIGYAFY